MRFSSFFPVATFTAILSILTNVVSSQTVVLQVSEPSAVAGFYPVAYVSQGDDGWSNVPNILLPENAVTAPLVFAKDATAADSLGCFPLINGDEVAGKIALIWRGQCTFAQKAYNAFEAGAAAVLLINNITSAGLITPGAAVGGIGESVSIPVASTDYFSGITLRESVLNNEAVAFLGANNVSVVFEDYGIIRNIGATFPIALARNPGEFSVPMGATVSNNSADTQDSLLVKASVLFDGNTLYEEIAEPISFASGQEELISFPDFSLNQYEVGEYKVTYSVIDDSEQSNLLTNFNANITFTDNYFSYTSFNSLTEKLIIGNYYRPNPVIFDGGYELCAHFRSPFAARLLAQGMDFSIVKNSSVQLSTLVKMRAYSWNQDFENLNDLDFADETQLVLLAEKTIPINLNNNDPLYFQEEFDNGIILVNNTRYLFCLAVNNPDISIGFAPDNVNYETANAQSPQPITILRNASDFFPSGFGDNLPIAFGIKMSEIPGCDQLSGGSITSMGSLNPCIGFGVNPLQLTVSNNTGNGKFGLIKPDGTIVAANTTGYFNMNNYPAGNYLAGYVSILETDFPEGINNINQLTVCHAVSNTILISSFKPNGGTIAPLGSTEICKNASPPQQLSFALSGNSGPNSIWAVIKPNFSEVLAVSPDGNFSWNAFPVGNYRVGHVSFGNTVNILNIDPQNLEGCIKSSNTILVSVSLCNAPALQLHPNPSSDATTVAISTPEEGSISLDVFDSSGKLVETIYSSAASPAVNELRIQYNAKHLPTGVYLFRLVTDKHVITQRFLLSK